ncbi:MAG: tRNA glutamyl-Q(34) synthetase GluQRS [Rhodothermales bacterium]|nr:tRNA glutamyl-Q(34) synthetase GluQRS [Rhodothermales bacterium]
MDTKQGQTRARGRFAPSPTGSLHLGSALSALLAWLSIRSKNGTFILRIEDVDPPREVTGAVPGIIEDLHWLGLDWDEGPDIGGPYGPYFQSGRHDIYADTIRRLARQRLIFPSTASRSELAELNIDSQRSATFFPKKLRPDRNTEPGWYQELDKLVGSHALRFVVSEDPITFIDRWSGPQSSVLADVCGDFVVRRKDGLYAYQLAVAVDDGLMEMTEVVRGRDLASSTFQQCAVMDSLGLGRPEYAHGPVICDENGGKLSKSRQSLMICSLREAGVDPRKIVGFLAAQAGIIPEYEILSPGELIKSYKNASIRVNDIILRDPELDVLQ